MLWDPGRPIILRSIADTTEPAAAIKQVYILYCVSHEVLLAAMFLMMEKITYRRKPLAFIITWQRLNGTVLKSGCCVKMTNDVLK